MNELLRREWYARGDVQMNIMPHLMGRETCFLVPHSIAESLREQGEGIYPVRCIKAHASSYLLNNMNAFNFFTRNYNLYHSIYSLNGMPMFTYKPLARREQQHEFFKNYENYVTGVIFVMDFDGDKKLPLLERIDAAKNNTIRACNIMDSCEVPYNVLFSGSKGFHVEVRGFPLSQEWKKQAAAFREIAMRLVLNANGVMVEATTPEGEDFDTMLTRRFSLVSTTDLPSYFAENYRFDMSIYTVTRIWKCPYSYDVTTDMIVLPLSHTQLRDFTLDMVKPENLYINLWHRGLLTRKGSINNFWTMAEQLGVDCGNWKT